MSMWVLWTRKMCSPAAMVRSVEADGALPPFFAFNWGCKMRGGRDEDGYQLCFIPNPLGNQDSLHPKQLADLSPLQMGRIHVPGFIMNLSHHCGEQNIPKASKQRAVFSLYRENPFNPRQPNQNRSLGDSGLPLVSKGAMGGLGVSVTKSHCL